MPATLLPTDSAGSAGETSFLPAPDEPSSCGTRAVPPPAEAAAAGPAAGRERAAARTPERYRIVKRLGSGAMGAVYLARDTALERDVALKSPTLDTGNPEVLARFLGEARAAANLRHPNICPLYDVGERDGRPYLTMAFIPGRTLADQIKQTHDPRADAPPAVADALRLVRTLADAMDHAHRQGVVHRDLKPANVLMDAHGQPFVTDFGLARRPELEEDNRLTHEGALIGTPAYMAPEQVRADPDVGPAADQYALGCILYELLTGRLPFGGSAVSILSKVLTDSPIPPATLRPDLPPAVGVLWKRMTARAASDRFPSLAEVRDTLDALLERLGGRASDGDRPFPDPAPTADRRRPAPVRPRRRGRRILAAAALSAAVGAAFFSGEVWEAAAESGGNVPGWVAAIPTVPAAAGGQPEPDRVELSRPGVRISRTAP